MGIIPLLGSLLLQSHGPFLSDISVESDVRWTSGSTVGKVYCRPAATADMVVQLSSTDPVVGVPASVVIPAGSNSASFTVTTAAVGVPKVAQLHASWSGWVQRTKVNLLPSSSSVGLAELSARSGQGGVWLEWDTPEDDLFGATFAGYTVQRREGRGAFLTLHSSVTGNTFVDTSASPGVDYTYRVQAVDKDDVTIKTSPEIAVEHTGGSASLTWVNPPSGTVSGTVQFQLSNPPGDQDHFQLFVDGRPYGSCSTTYNVEGGSSQVIEVVLDTAALPSGTRTITVASDHDANVLRTAAPLSLSVENPLAAVRLDDIVETSHTDWGELSASVSSKTAPFTISIRNEGGITIKSWSGIGPPKVVWNARDAAGATVPDGIYPFEITTGSPGSSRYGKIYKLGAQPSFISLVNHWTSFHPATSLEYADTVHRMLKQIRATQEPGMTILHYVVGEETNIDRSTIAKIRRWIKMSGRYFYLQGHGSRLRSETDARSRIYLGNNLELSNYSVQRRSPQQISIPDLSIPFGRYKFIGIDTCNSAGRSDAPADPWQSKMTRYPNGEWATAFRVSLGLYSGALLAFNGLNYKVGQNGFHWAWLRWKTRFWEALAGGASVTEAATLADIALPAYAQHPNPSSFWTQYSRGKRYILGEWKW